MQDNFHDLVSRLLIDTKGSADGSFLEAAADSSLWAFGPELVICATIVLMLLVKVPKIGRRLDTFWIALIGAIVAFALTMPWKHLAGGDESMAAETVTRMEIFTGLLVYDTFAVFVRSILLGFLVLFIIFTRLSGLPDREDGPDIYTLVFGGTLGMCLMVTANHLLMVFLAVEMASVPSYVLAGMLKGQRKASEAALKYAVYGAGTAGVMLYGISLVAGLLNSAHLPTLAIELSERLPGMESSELLVLALGGLMIMVGLAFKLSAVPFHFWCPDVFEGATAEVNAFLSVASKGAALALLLRVAIGFSTLAPQPYTLADLEAGRPVADDAMYFGPGVRSDPRFKALKPPDAAASVNTKRPAVLMNVVDEPAKADKAAPSKSDAKRPSAKTKKIDDGLDRSRSFIGLLVAVLAIITCTFGNLAAYGQTNIKRLLAYSTIAHAGYMMMVVPAVVEAAGHDTAVAQRGVAGLCLYIFVYLFMNLGAFAIVAFLRNAMKSEEIADYAGLLRRCPGTVIALTAILFGLVGLPPLAGFIGKFAIFAALADSFNVTNKPYLLILLLAGAINTAISLFYYLRVVKTMTMDPEPENRPPFVFSDVSLQGAFVWLITLPTLVLIVSWNWISNWALEAARHLFS